MSGWDKAREHAKSSGDGSIFLKIEDGDRIVCAFVGEPVIRQVVWNDARNGYEDYHPSHDERGMKSVARYRVNVYLPDEKAVKILEMNKTTFNKVDKAISKYGLQKFYEIERTGEGPKTVYDVNVELNIPFDPIAISRVTLHDLRGRKTAPAPQGPPVPNYPTDIPFDHITEEQARELVTRLKALPRERVSQFLTKFQIQQVKTLISESYGDAIKLLSEWENQENQLALDDAGL